ncbi:piggyBac transposable element-derived protein 3-like [Leptopilina heterotoma]|uniref:piggyBac transposable element-derived protein 3-like n=1 Tax=Leptopilina heterotoma TaxID=63436 RepID=UPI001CA94BF3|nr:piggyBac transposable element-derived protein 3-like [Leptopilina heterotoma]
MSRKSSKVKNSRKVLESSVEEFSDNQSDDFDSDSDVDYVIESEHNSDTEEEVDTEDEEEEEEKAPGGYFGKGKNCDYYWSAEKPNSKKRMPQHNIILKLPTLKSSALELGETPDCLKVWELFFDKDIIEKIVLYTNQKLNSVNERLSRNSRDPDKFKVPTYLKETSVVEIRAFFGLLLLTSIYGSAHENVESLFSTDCLGRPIFSATMSSRRFKSLSTYLRFDDSTTRSDRKKIDRTAAISEIFQNIIDNCQKVYNVGAYACIDEMLVAFRGRCSFRIYMPNKPAKYGVKIMCLTDARNSYLYNAYIYCGKNSDSQGLTPEEQKFLKPTQSVLRLSKPLYKSNRNVTADNWFSSVEVVQELKKNGLTYVGTIKKNKKEIPKEFLPSKTRQVNSSFLGHSKDGVLLSFVPKKNKAVLIISSMHSFADADQNNNGLPEMISFYNLTKGGVDSMDLKCAIYQSSRRTRRWPMAVFFRLLDISVTNAFILYKCYKNASELSRRKFITNVAMDLILPHINCRKKDNLPRKVKNMINISLKTETSIKDSELSDKLNAGRKTCILCDYKLKRKTAYKCAECDSPVCLQCSLKVCVYCLKGTPNCTLNNSQNDSDNSSC